MCGERCSRRRTSPSAEPVLRGADLTGIVARRRRLYDVELRRRRIPRLLRSHGTDVEAAMMAAAAALPQPAATDRLAGTPPST